MTDPVAPEGFDYFEVAADVGIHAWAPTLEGCWRQSALGMFNLMVPLDAVAAADSREVGSQGESLELLLVNWLNDLLYLHDVEGFALRDVTTLRVEGERVHATLTGEAVDPDRHPRGVLVKAATLHQLAVVREAERTRVRVVLDI